VLSCYVAQFNAMRTNHCQIDSKLEANTRYTTANYQVKIYDNKKTTNGHTLFCATEHDRFNGHLYSPKIVEKHT